MAYSQEILRNLFPTLLAIIFFLIVTQPWVYMQTNRIFPAGWETCDGNGCPTNFGRWVHAAVFGLLILLSVLVPWNKICFGTLGRFSLTRGLCF